VDSPAFRTGLRCISHVVHLISRWRKSATGLSCEIAAFRAHPFSDLSPVTYSNFFIFKRLPFDGSRRRAASVAIRRGDLPDTACEDNGARRYL